MDPPQLLRLLHACEPQDLLKNYVEWGKLVVDNVERSKQSSAVLPWLPCCHALCKRLGPFMDVTGVRREAAGQATKLVVVSLEWLSGKGVAEAMAHTLQAAAVQLLTTILSSIPTVVRQHMPRVQSHLVNLIISPTLPFEQRQAAAVCLASLPLAGAGMDALTELTGKLLLSIHDVLDLMFMGLDAPLPGVQESRQQRTVTYTTGLLGAPRSWSDERPKDLSNLLCIFSACVDCLQSAICAPNPLAKPIPCAAILSLLERILSFHPGNLENTGIVPYSQHAFSQLCAAVTAVHAACWMLLQDMFQVVGSSLLPLFHYLQRLLLSSLRQLSSQGTAALERVPASLRKCLTDTTKQYLTLAGFPAAKALCTECVAYIMLELYGKEAARKAGTSQKAAGTHKNKKARTSYSLDQWALEQAAAGYKVSQVIGDNDKDVGAQEAALQLLGTLLEVGGPALAPEERAKLDSIAFHMASTAVEGSEKVRRSPLTSQQAPLVEVFAVAAFKCLVASLLSPLPHRPPFLSQGLSLIYWGSQCPSHALTQTCHEALLSLEPFLHPRSCPMSSTVQYHGMDDIPPLTRPRMWTAIHADSIAELSSQPHEAVQNPGGPRDTAMSSHGPSTLGHASTRQAPAFATGPSQASPVFTSAVPAILTAQPGNGSQIQFAPPTSTYQTVEIVGGVTTEPGVPTVVAAVSIQAPSQNPPTPFTAQTVVQAVQTTVQPVIEAEIPANLQFRTEAIISDAVEDASVQTAASQDNRVAVVNATEANQDASNLRKPEVQDTDGNKQEVLLAVTNVITAEVGTASLENESSKAGNAAEVGGEQVVPAHVPGGEQMVQGTEQKPDVQATAMEVEAVAPQFGKFGPESSDSEGPMPDIDEGDSDDDDDVQM